MNKEKGAMIVESAFVFPIMFFVLFFLIFMGNMFYMRSRVDSIVTEAAVSASAYCADPLLAEVIKNQSVPRSIDKVKPYHNLFSDASDANEVRNKMDQKLHKLGSGYFGNMNLRRISINKFAYNAGVLVSTFDVDVEYCIQFPIRFLGSSSPTVLNIHSFATVPVVDTGDFILNVDMAVDYAQNLGLDVKLAKLKQQISQFLSK